MTYSPEFFKQRSFEVVWAVFRVAKVCARAGIAQLLENRALAYIAAKDISTLSDLLEAVLLAHKIEELSDTNFSVLEREINSLTSFLQEYEKGHAHNLDSKVNQADVSLDDVFSELPVLFSEFAQTINKDAMEAMEFHTNRKNEQSISHASPETNISESGKQISGNRIYGGIKSSYINLEMVSEKSPEMGISESGKQISGNSDTSSNNKISGISGNFVARRDTNVFGNLFARL